jgi:hypothetical protein
MSIPMFISAAIVAAAAFIAVRTVRRRQQGAAGPAAYGGPPPPSVADRRLARRNAKVPYQGRPEDEPHVAHALQALGSHLTHLYRADEALRQARQQDVAAQDALADATNERPRVAARTQGALERGAGISATTDDPAEAARWSAASAARAERTQAEELLVRRRKEQLEAARSLRTAETRAIDALAAAAAAGLVPINGYLAAYNQARTAEGSRPIGVLGEEWIHHLVRNAVQPIDLAPPPPPPDPARRAHRDQDRARDRVRDRRRTPVAVG